ncbi:MAG TPA: hypothetical protein DDZ80_02995, partial [Cyanobacteria bacterium UBA8803]|nr:hypothetical protein [Cyanobacteria bacterium UBA8803]
KPGILPGTGTVPCRISWVTIIFKRISFLAVASRRPSGKYIVEVPVAFFVMMLLPDGNGWLPDATLSDKPVHF